MASLTITEAFRRFGASLVNPQWAVAAISADGSCVMSCWAHHIKKHDNKLRLEDRLSRWAHNAPGNNLLREHLQKIQADNLDVRLVLARTSDTQLVDSGGDASQAKKTFAVREDLIGKLVEFDGDTFIIDFARSAT